MEQDPWSGQRYLILRDDEAGELEQAVRLAAAWLSDPAGLDRDIAAAAAQRALDILQGAERVTIDSEETEDGEG